MKWLVESLSYFVRAFFIEPSLPMWTKWIIFMFVFLLIELFHRSWIVLWFAIGALTAALAAAFSDSIDIQFIVFFAASALSLLFGRRLTKRTLFKGAATPTNIHAVIGREELCVEEIDNEAATGAVKLFGTEWKARSFKDGVHIDKGQLVKVVGIDGLCLIVEPVPKISASKAAVREPADHERGGI